MKQPLRLATCPRCLHQGGLPGTIPSSARIRCTSCGAHLQVRHCVGPKPCKLKTPSRETELKRKAAADAIERAGNPELNDRLDDLF
jgi:hypothetical protein